MACEDNLASNRQTRMLADLRLVNCYNRTGMAPAERDRTMLASAKRNLLDMAYFGLTEYQAESQALFEDTFNMDFKVPFEQLDARTQVRTIAFAFMTCFKFFAFSSGLQKPRCPWRGGHVSGAGPERAGRRAVLVRQGPPAQEAQGAQGG